MGAATGRVRVPNSPDQPGDPGRGHALAHGGVDGPPYQGARLLAGWALEQWEELDERLAPDGVTRVSARRLLRRAYLAVVDGLHPDDRADVDLQLNHTALWTKQKQDQQREALLAAGGEIT